ncbi:MAG: GNAT family N-acetyltransferase [Maricaulis sp.]|uniref:N-acetyltransferase GCN5 n=1 Tax=Maricaulis virginensis TaxID=144022 RepID=A0A9W6IQC1_9PROT|nr:GNAT family N-acetyltransferase [Maricaulis virginensis]MAC39612.1 GNAT family N-acetyltransferase [Oceanicaulis sp.]MAZ91166.1 GNAT family N-acetyltransferase [Maricaulis sp.]GLK53405.1 N-acetyltransferase GCN5 [Maricaulis virginensis]|tara:strand:+ start:167 stop:718 length:552 start_codon:yes stop_codon:yes gene_type:complete
MPTDGVDLRIEKFDPARHDRAGFSCGVDRLDNYLKLTAKRQQVDDMTRVYVMTADGDNRILGYHAINLGMMDVTELPKKPRGTPAHGELPILFLGQVAVSQSAQGRGIGSILMHHVFEKASRIGEEAGCFALVLDVMNDGGEAAFARRCAWYRDFGFQDFASQAGRMFMTMKQVRAIIQDPVV